jgi:hypothetical protein
VTLKGGKLVLEVTDATPKAHVPLCYLLLCGDEVVAKEDGLLQGLMEDDQFQATLVGHHTNTVHPPLSVV